MKINVFKTNLVYSCNVTIGDSEYSHYELINSCSANSDSLMFAPN